MIITGVTTDEFDGHRVAVLALRSRPDGFRVEAEVTLTDGGRSNLEDQELVWWARDDRGQNYLGTWDGPSRQTMSGELRFFPLLDPEATRLDLMPSTPTTRGVIAVRWPGDRPPRDSCVQTCPKTSALRTRDAHTLMLGDRRNVADAVIRSDRTTGTKRSFASSRRCATKWLR
jgi:hypothetical protein